MDRFKEQLSNQLSFLERSCSSFDSGYQNEAIRMSVILRILFHDTKNTTSLLAHLNSKDINIISTCTGTPIPPEQVSTYLGLIQVHGDGLKPKLGFTPRIRNLSLDAWWNQVILIPAKGSIFSRKVLILNMADKDGGAHVDAKLTTSYESIINSGWTFTHVDNIGNVITGPVKNFHYISIRQISYEVLNSTDITKILSE